MNDYNNRNIKNEILWFVSISFVLTYALGIYTWNKGGLNNPISHASMYMPALCVIGLYLLKFKTPLIKNGDLGFLLTGWKYWLIAPLLITAISLSSFAISYLFNPEMFDSLESIKDALEKQGFYWGNITIGFLAVLLINSLIGSLLNIPMFLGEEIGWRAFLQPRLFHLFKPKTAFVIGGSIWALWHAVMIAQGLNYPNLHPALGLLMMVLFCIPVGIIIQYFYVKSRSIFVAALAHAALNKSTMSISFILKEESYNTFLYGPTGLVGIAIFGIIAIFLLNNIDWKKEHNKSH